MYKWCLLQNGTREPALESNLVLRFLHFPPGLQCSGFVIGFALGDALLLLPPCCHAPSVHTELEFGSDRCIDD